MRAEEILELAAPEIRDGVARHLVLRHGWHGSGDVAVAHRREHAVTPVPGWDGPWSAWTVAPHPHIPLPGAPGGSWGRNGAL